MEEVKPLIWSSKVLDSACRKGIKNHMLASILIFGLPIDILLSIFLTTRIDHISPGFLLAYVSCIIWLNFGPYFIWYYECRTMNRFFTKLNGLLTPQDIRDLNNKCRSSFSKNYWITIMPWMFFLFAVYGKRFALDVAGTFGYNDYWTWLLSIPIIWIPIIAGMGTWGVVTTITTINDVVKRNLKLDPLHTDKHGGLGCIGDYAIGTTALISSGSLFIPMALQLAYQINSAKSNIYILVAFFIAILLFSFFYPIYITQAGAKRQRITTLESLRNRYNEVLDKQKNVRIGKDIKLAYLLDAMRIRTEYSDLASINLYPFDVSILNKLVSSLLFPVAITFIQQFFGWK